MADRWRRDLLFPLGTTSTRVADVGPADPTPEEPSTWGSLRCGFDGVENVAGYTATVRLPEGHEVGPLDIPFVFGCELPARIAVTPPAGGSAAQHRVKLQATRNSPSNVADGAIRAQLVLSAAALDVPQWVTAISILSSGVTAQLLDAAAVLVDVITGLRVPRPRNAVQVVPSADTVVVLHYDL